MSKDTAKEQPVESLEDEISSAIDAAGDDYDKEDESETAELLGSGNDAKIIDDLEELSGLDRRRRDVLAEGASKWRVHRTEEALERRGGGGGAVHGWWGDDWRRGSSLR